MKAVCVVSAGLQALLQAVDGDVLGRCAGLVANIPASYALVHLLQIGRDASHLPVERFAFGHGVSSVIRLNSFNRACRPVASRPEPEGQ